MQVKTGLCSITNGSNRVIAATGIDWSTVVAGVSWFTPIGSPYVYNVATTSAPGVSASGNWELTVVGTISDATNNISAYSIQKDFTTNLGLPIIEPGDVQTAQIWARMVNLLDLTWIGGGGGGGGAGVSSQFPAAITTAGNTDSTQSEVTHRGKLVLNAGSGAYTRTFTLPTAGRTAGNKVELVISVAASVNPTISVRNATSGGTELFRWTGDGTATTLWASFTFDGATWTISSSGII